MSRSTATELQILEEMLDEQMRSITPGGSVKLEVLRNNTEYPKPLWAFSKLVRKRYLVVGKGKDVNVFNLPTAVKEEKEIWKKKPIDEDGENITTLIRRLIKTVERQDRELEACRKEIARLNKIKNIPSLSERARKALARFGD